MRKAGELGRRRLSLALARPRMVHPLARYPSRPHAAVLVLQRGETATTAYYFRPRLNGHPAVYADIGSSPAECPLMRQSDQPLLVIVSRYITAPWLEALEGVRGRIARLAFFMDDDLPAMMTDDGLPTSARGKVATHYASHVERLSALASEVWVSTTVLAERYPEAGALVLPPLPEAEPAPPAPDGDKRVVYHGTDSHPRERRFVLRVARRLLELAPEAAVEITGDAALAREAADLPNVRVAPQTPWLDYLASQQGRSAAICLAPLHLGAVNDARAHVKAFDAARIGAAGLYADAPAYRGFVRDGEDGLVLPMEPEAWAQAVARLLTAPAERRALNVAAAARLRELRQRDHRLPRPER
jgi:glycosyltransferase involved in cell wall biosynthesis